ncbi:hypothetical protein SLEP1_g16849 [Rubroshorea leprosula]|uniref:Uncharacterized protein n=1 Tax=Rubroshorea leprosula TaxID=152421 RepID=A0AAV5IY60_9ROSI|nr:hypothetical protein SLEP1_g16849 [Rubroshorea leprosula]
MISRFCARSSIDSSRPTIFVRFRSLKPFNIVKSCDLRI